MIGIPVLMYHALEDSSHPTGYADPADQIYVLQAGTFKSHLTYLRNNGYQPILFKDLNTNNPLPPKTVILTFDDGHVSNYEIAFPILKEHDFRAEFFITTAWIGHSNFLSPGNIQEIAAAGMGVGSHGVSHTLLNHLPVKTAMMEIYDSKRCLEEILGRDIHALSLPGGRRPPREANPIEAGYKWVCSSQVGLYDGERNWDVPRIAIRKDAHFENFIKIVQGNSLFFRRAILKAKILTIAKELLGNQLYSTLHRTMVGRRLRII